MANKNLKHFIDIKDVAITTNSQDKNVFDFL